MTIEPAVMVFGSAIASHRLSHFANHSHVAAVALEIPVIYPTETGAKLVKGDCPRIANLREMMLYLESLLDSVSVVVGFVGVW
jgi:hypothetical protein